MTPVDFATRLKRLEPGLRVEAIEGRPNYRTLRLNLRYAILGNWGSWVSMTRTEIVRVLDQLHLDHLSPDDLERLK